MFGIHKKKIQSNIQLDSIPALVGEGCLFEGNITSPSSARIDGKVVGSVTAKGGLIIGEMGTVKGGEIKASDIIVYGKVEEGKIETERLEIIRGANVIADVFTKSFIIEDGGIYNGRCVMERTTDKIVGNPFFKL
jgi:cytoskeletal protein CcmA (bactofilin family)